jgi:hypothetical protein
MVIDLKQRNLGKCGYRKNEFQETKADREGGKKERGRMRRRQREEQDRQKGWGEVGRRVMAEKKGLTDGRQRSGDAWHRQS